MIGALMILGAVVLWVLPIRPLAGHVAWTVSNNLNQVEPDNEDWDQGWIFSVLWPVTVPIWTLKQLLCAASHAYARHAPRLPAVGAEVAALRAAERDRLAKLGEAFEAGKI